MRRSMTPLFPSRQASHRRRAAWSAWWASAQTLRLDQRAIRSSDFDPIEDDWLRLVERGVMIGTTGFYAPDGFDLAALTTAWPMTGGYFEKIGLWVRGAEPMAWQTGRARGPEQRWTIRPQTVGLTLNHHDERAGFEPLDPSSTITVLETQTLAGAPHPFNPRTTSDHVTWLLEQPRRGRPSDDHPVFHAFGPQWWTRGQVEAMVQAMMEAVRSRLPDGQWIDPNVLCDSFLGAGATRSALRQQLVDLIDHRDLRSPPQAPLGNPGDVQALLEAGGERLREAVVDGWNRHVAASTISKRDSHA